MDERKSAPPSLAGLMDVEVEPERLWQADELGSILHHQLRAPLETELGELHCPDVAHPDQVTFGDLLHQANPPVELLERVRNFAKGQLNLPHSPLPHEVASVLYYCSILVAVTRCGRRITSLDDRSLVVGCRWVLSQSWVEPAIHEVCEKALQRLEAEG
jgi:hypothetical protein